MTVVEIPKALVSAELRAYEVEEIVVDRGNTVTSPSIRGMENMIPIMPQVCIELGNVEERQRAVIATLAVY